MVTTTWNTTDIDPEGDGLQLGDNPSGQLPLIADTVVDSTNGDVGIGGNPLQQVFPGFNPNFDITSLTIIDPIYPVPVPAPFWLFGSGLLGLAAAARRGRCVS